MVLNRTQHQVLIKQHCIFFGAQISNNDGPLVVLERAAREGWRDQRSYGHLVILLVD